MIERYLLPLLESNLNKGKALIITGARQTGKTTLLKMLLQKNKEHTLFLNCDEPDIRKRLTDVTSVALKNLIGDASLICIDEAQRIRNIGITLKLIIDNYPENQLVVTGSSTLGIRDSINEPLTGRKFEYSLFPLSESELSSHFGSLAEERNLEQRIIFGSYPDVVNHPGDSVQILKNIANSYLYKDIFAYMDIRKPEIVERLVEMLALQVGSEVSYNELANALQIDINTVQRYIQLLEESFVIFRLRAFSGNIRNEIKKSRKIYFYDNGIRNAVIDNFNSVSLRNDIGALWENWLISERMKYNSMNYRYLHSHFWRTKQQQEVDYIEQSNGQLAAFEFKWNENKRSKLPVTFAKAYPQASFQCITRENYEQFIGRCDL